jgi:putative membrane protein
MIAILFVPTGGAGAAILWGFMGIAFWILLIGLIVLAVRGVRTPARHTEGPAVRLLEERYARGEITREEFLERRAVLDPTWPDAPGGASR